MTAESRSPTLEDAYADGRKDERAAIVAMLRALYAEDMHYHFDAAFYARMIEQMDIQPKDTDAKP